MILLQGVIAMKTLLTVPAMFIAINAAAECPALLPTDKPAVPDGTVASRAEMYEAQLETRVYVENIENFLLCKQERIEPWLHNIHVRSAEAAAEDYNRELQRYRDNRELAAL